MVFSEDSRVKIPCILHLVRLGYHYLSLKDAAWDEDTNIFPELFHSAIARINPDMEAGDIDRLLVDVKLLLDNEDLGKAFYEKLTEHSGLRLIDFENFENNSFHVVTELTCKNGDDEFRPDITLLINGLPLAFIEVKKPNNREGVLAERNRIITRSRNPRFRRFINITQLMVFSNNMEYEDGSPQPIEGAFYASPSYDAPIFNYFREEEALNLAELLADEDDATENDVLRDNNLNVIKHSPEFITLKEELERLFKKKKLNEVTRDKMTANIGALNAIHDKVRELNRQNNQLRAKYHGDAKYTRIHKRLQEQGTLSETERRIFEALTGVKQQADKQVLQNTQLLANESYFERMMMPLVIGEFQTRQKIKLDPDASRTINHLVVSEYMNEYASGSRTGART